MKPLGLYLRAWKLHFLSKRVSLVVSRLVRQVEMKCYGLSRPHILVVSAYQCLALMLFNRGQVTRRSQPLASRE